MKRYLVLGGPVVSRNDGQIHYVSAQQLVRLYQVRPDECVLIDMGDKDTQLALRASSLNRLKILRPQHSGDYRIKLKVLPPLPE